MKRFDAMYFGVSFVRFTKWRIFFHNHLLAPHLGKGQSIQPGFVTKMFDRFPAVGPFVLHWKFRWGLLDHCRYGPKGTSFLKTFLSYRYKAKNETWKVLVSKCPVDFRRLNFVKDDWWHQMNRTLFVIIACLWNTTASLMSVLRRCKHTLHMLRHWLC